MDNKYSLITLFLFFVAASAWADTTTGDQSPVIKAGGDANVNYNVTLSPEGEQALIQELMKQGIPASEHARELKILTAKYQELMRQLAEYESQDELVKQARAALSKGKLDKAEKWLQQAEARETALFEQRQQRIAERNYELAQISELKFEYQTAIQRYRKTVKFAPEKSQAWHNLAVIYDRTGDSKQALETWKSLLKHASGQNNDYWRAWSRIKIGDVLAKQGFSEQAISEYQQAQQLFAAQLKDDPNNSGWQRDLSVSYDRIGDMHKSNGDGDKAIQAYQDGLTIRETLARRDSKRADWQRDMIVSYVKMSQVIPEKQKHYLQQALSIVRRLDKENRLYPVDRWMIKGLRDQIKSL